MEFILFTGSAFLSIALVWAAYEYFGVLVPRPRFSRDELSVLLSLVEEHYHDDDGWLKDVLLARLAHSEKPKYIRALAFWKIGEWRKMSLKNDDIAKLYSVARKHAPRSAATIALHGEMKRITKGRIAEDIEDGIDGYYESALHNIDYAAPVDTIIPNFQNSMISVFVTAAAIFVSSIQIMFPHGWIGAIANFLAIANQELQVEWPMLYASFVAAVLILTIYSVFFLHVTIYQPIADHKHEPEIHALGNDMEYISRQLETLNAQIAEVRSNLILESDLEIGQLFEVEGDEQVQTC